MDQLETTPANRTIPIEVLSQEPYCRVISYPRADSESVNTRINQFERLGIDSVRFTGASRINGLSILGKGCVGIVLEARSKGKNTALKIRRTDANRANMHSEAEYQRLANKVAVGPAVMGEEPDVLAMELVTGETLPKWFSRETPAAVVRAMLRSVLEQCFRLDQVGLDHGELSHAHKNVLVSSLGPVIVDFESSSSTRHPHNLTSLVQYLFFSGKIAGQVQETVAIPDRTRLLESLRAYKLNSGPEQFGNVLSAAKL